MRNTIFLVIFLFTYTAGLAQDVPFDKSYFKEKKKEFKEADGFYADGDGYFENGQYYLALQSYLKANEFNPNNSRLNFQIGISYMASVQSYKSLEYFLKAKELNVAVNKDIEYYIGRGYHLNGQYAKAIPHYQNYKKGLLPNQVEDIEAVVKRIEECENALKLIDKPTRAFIDNLMDINTSYTEHSPVISADASTMLFTSTREGSKGGVLDDITQEYDEDIYVSYKVNGRWTAPTNVGEPLNSHMNDATVGLSSDGQMILIYNGRKRNGDIQSSELDGEEWTYPEWLPKSVNSNEKETSASLANNDQVLYFISSREGGYGGTDIYVVHKDKKGRWGEAENLGPAINTKYDEESVFMHPDGRTLYFSSQGHSSIGGYDIFRAVKGDDGKWSTPENLGIPVNTPDDDLSLVLSADGKYGYFSSTREGGKGRYDIYQITFLGPEKPLYLSNEDQLLASFKKSVSDNVLEKSVEIKTIRLTVVKGIVKDAITNEPIKATIEVVDNDKDEIVFNNESNSKTGKFLVTLPSGKNYGLAVKAENYLFHSENFNIPKATAYQEIEKEILLNNVKKDVKIVLKNVFFDLGKAILRPTSYPELNRLAKLLKDVPTLKIEISGHTDNVGSATSNQKLSEQRAKAVVEYIKAQEISEDRLTYVGYGEEQPIADNNTKDGRQQNRRVEFKVLSK
jgi:outer membrane protein OmpA-like peptidoglycan-associated protein/Tol biopolymer transport system component